MNIPLRAEHHSCSPETRSVTDAARNPPDVAGEQNVCCIRRAAPCKAYAPYPAVATSSTDGLFVSRPHCALDHCARPGVRSALKLCARPILVHFHRHRSHRGQLSDLQTSKISAATPLEVPRRCSLSLTRSPALPTSSSRVLSYPITTHSGRDSPTALPTAIGQVPALSSHAHAHKHRRRDDRSSASAARAFPYCSIILAPTEILTMTDCDLASLRS